MTEDRTITESEFERFEAAYRSEWTAQIEPSLRAAFESIGFNIVPDPVPEPMNGEIALDSRGVAWMRDAMGGLWSPAVGPSSLVRDWDDLGDTHGPLRIYAEVKP